MALHEDEPPILIESSTLSNRTAYESWKRTNCISKMFMKTYINKSIRGLIFEYVKAKNFIKVVEEYLVGFDKVRATILMKKLLGIKHNNSNNMHEHIMEMRDIAA